MAPSASGVYAEETCVDPPIGVESVTLNEASTEMQEVSRVTDVQQETPHKSVCVLASLLLFLTFSTYVQQG